MYPCTLACTIDNPIKCYNSLQLKTINRNSLEDTWDNGFLWKRFLFLFCTLDNEHRYTSAFSSGTVNGNRSSLSLSRTRVQQHGLHYLTWKYVTKYHLARIIVGYELLRFRRCQFSWFSLAHCLVCIIKAMQRTVEKENETFYWPSEAKFKK